MLKFQLHFNDGTYTSTITQTGVDLTLVATKNIDSTGSQVLVKSTQATLIYTNSDSTLSTEIGAKSGKCALKGKTLNILNVGGVQQTAPSSAADTGLVGDVRICSDAIYVCTATNTWKKVAIATW